MAAKIKTAAVGYPVTLAEAKAQCRVDGSDEDALLNGLIASATDHVEKYTGRAILSQVWLDYFTEFSDVMALTVGPVASIVSIKYYNGLGVQTAVDAASYYLDDASLPARVLRKPGYSYPSTDCRENGIVIEYGCGEATAQPSIKHAILLLIGQLYANREATDIQQAARDLLQQYRIYG